MSNTYFNASNYKRFKQLTFLWLPAIGYLYFLASLFAEVPLLEEALTTIMTLIFAFAIILRGSTKRYILATRPYDGLDGQMIVTDKQDGGKIFSLELDTSPDAMELKDVVAFKVSRTVS